MKTTNTSILIGIAGMLVAAQTAIGATYHGLPGVVQRWVAPPKIEIKPTENNNKTDKPDSKLEDTEFAERAALFGDTDKGKAPPQSYVNRNGWKVGTCVSEKAPDEKMSALLMFFKAAQSSEDDEEIGTGAMIRLSDEEDYFQRMSKRGRQKAYRAAPDRLFRMLDPSEPVKDKALHFTYSIYTKHKGGPFRRSEYFVRLVKVGGKSRLMFKVVNTESKVDDGPIEKVTSYCM